MNHTALPHLNEKNIKGKSYYIRMYYTTLCILCTALNQQKGILDHRVLCYIHMAV